MDQWCSKLSESFSLDRYWSIECSFLGDMGPTTCSWSPPENGPEELRGSVWRPFSAGVRVRLRSLLFLLSLYLVHKFTVCFRVRPAKRRAQNLQGTSFFNVRVSFCCLEGGSLDGGDLVSPRFLGPSRSTSEGCGAAHGPRHPAYLLLLGLK